MDERQHIHICKGCRRPRECRGLFCAHPHFEQDICSNCNGARLIQYNAAGFAALDRLAKADKTPR